MSSKTYRLKVKKIPLAEDIVYETPNFPPFKELHLDLLENKTKLKKNPPKAVFVRNEVPVKITKQDSKKMEQFDVEDDLTLEELEKSYNNNNNEHEADHVFDVETEDEQEPTHDNTYNQQEFNEEEQAEEDQEEKQRKRHSELLFKFMVLRRQYPNVEIPDFNEHSDLGTMERVYEQIIRKVSLDSSVENYKMYLTGGFMVLEWVSTNWLKIDLGGFTQQQLKNMNKYDRLLVELGEKNYSTLGSRFPVEIRLIFLIIFNAGLFYVQKMIFGGGSGSGSGDGMMNLLGSFMGMGSQQQASTQAPKSQPKKRGGMRGPTITPEEVEDMSQDR